MEKNAERRKNSGLRRVIKSRWNANEILNRMIGRREAQKAQKKRETRTARVQARCPRNTLDTRNADFFRVVGAFRGASPILFTEGNEERHGHMALLGRTKSDGVYHRLHRSSRINAFEDNSSMSSIALLRINAARRGSARLRALLLSFNFQQSSLRLAAPKTTSGGD